MSLSDDNQTDVIDAFNTTSRYLDDILNINNVFLTIWQVKYTLQSSNFIKPIPLIPKPHFWTCICLFLMILYLPKFMINVTTLILKWSIFHLVVIFLALHPMESISLNSFLLLEHLAMLLASTLAIKSKLRNFLNKAISIINFAKPFLNFIDHTII